MIPVKTSNGFGFFDIQRTCKRCKQRKNLEKGCKKAGKYAPFTCRDCVRCDSGVQS